MKGLFDIYFSFFAIFILSPVFLLITIILILFGTHEVFFLQERIGLNRKPFKVWKFATMLKNSDLILNY